MSSLEIIKQLREKTQMSISDIKKALGEAGGDIEKVLDLLKKRGAEIMEKKASRVSNQGLIDAYCHQGKIGVLVEVNCETDFVSRNQDFKEFVHDLSLQISSMNPDDVDDLLGQEFIKDSTKIVRDLVKEITAKLGEKIVIKRFSRFELREEK